MYSLDINFLNDRAERATEAGPVQTRTASDSNRPLFIGLAVGIFPLALVLVSWFLLQQRNAALQARQAELDTRLTALQAQLTEVDTINAQIAQINAENQALATVFDRIKPWSAILQDVRDRVPTGVQVSLIEQKDPASLPGAAAAAPPPPPAAPADPNQPAAPAAVPEPPPDVIEVSGQARTFNDVNDFLLTLQRSPFLQADQTRLVTAELVDNPTQIRFADEQNSGNVEVQLPRVVQFRIQSTLTTLPASELLQDLERTLAVGLPARIEALRERGVIQP
ncbi:PilN domain-containing protein [Oscillatoria sp. FACHB-1407]|uniref:PilN domain-containing protein n=1 Tax=Oscillatoria sp. FACHB-1407 TaxID=2692847 RepID=UPI001684959A|nr:PilN domain-containing protein [Oscillatoria sp. FACHB-1407]MBD2462743.1 PilN domain-containing protein [Oscillatoria sp. FACHB-1407]